MNFDVRPLSAGLYFVATPIGSARDITLRALDILASADVIAAEDTRTAKKIMDIHGVPIKDRTFVAFHDHSTDKVVDRLVSVMKDGKSVACVSEAGTPLIADPGYELGVAAVEAGLDVTTAPGASAVLAALTVSALPTDRFAFVGFLPAAKVARRGHIAGLRDLDFTLVFYESPKRLTAMLHDVAEVLGPDRQVVVCRELTKKFEETQRGPVSEVLERFMDRSIKGEIVVLVGRAGAQTVTDDDLRGALTNALQTMRIKDAATTVAGAFGLPRKDVYQMALDLKNDVKKDDL
jgi:16S rRNA (cytidine1402-2'-O)-methyltransferase